MSILIVSASQIRLIKKKNILEIEASTTDVSTLEQTTLIPFSSQKQGRSYSKFIGRILVPINFRSNNNSKTNSHHFSYAAKYVFYLISSFSI